MNKYIKTMGKDILKIPVGPYCYTIKEIVNDDKHGTRIITNPCPYSTSKEINGVKVAWCDYLDRGGLLNEEFDFQKLVDHYGSEDKVFSELDLSLLFDDVKECGINYGDEEDLVKDISI